MQKNEVKIFEDIFDNQDAMNTRTKKMSIKHREFNIIKCEEDVIYLSSSSTFATRSEIYQRRIVKIIKH